jgi:hypothetical protein
MVDIAKYTLFHVGTVKGKTVVEFARPDISEGVRSIVFADVNGNGELDRGDKKLLVTTFNKGSSGRYDWGMITNSDIAAFGDRFKAAADSAQAARAAIAEWDVNIKRGECSMLSFRDGKMDRAASFEVQYDPPLSLKTLQECGSRNLERCLTEDAYKQGRPKNVRPESCFIARGGLRTVLQKEVADVTISTGKYPSLTMDMLGLFSSELVDVEYTALIGGAEVLFTHFDIAPDEVSGMAVPLAFPPPLPPPAKDGALAGFPKTRGAIGDVPAGKRQRAEAYAKTVAAAGSAGDEELAKQIELFYGRGK